MNKVERARREELLHEYLVKAGHEPMLTRPQAALLQRLRQAGERREYGSLQPAVGGARAASLPATMPRRR